ncbi:DUF4198 domain-containing protein [Algimonas porphyrae]|nr:DUF4198 domain-containing protein [Algimonas porphyrae]
MPQYRSQLKFRHVPAMGLIAAVLGFGITASAHDFWLQPKSFAVDTATDFAVDVMIGHPEDQMPWSLAPERLIGLRTFGPGPIQDQVQFYEPSDGHLTINVQEPGLFWLAIETQDSVSRLESDRFNDYIDKEGLTAVQLHRIEARTTDDAGIERYSRRSKALIAAGQWRERPHDHITDPLGLTLEIIPKINPMTLDPGAAMPLEVRYRGKPLAGAKIKTIRLDETDVREPVMTDQNGLAVVEKPIEGQWMYHVIWGTPLPHSYDQDYDTIFSSMTFSAE